MSNYWLCSNRPVQLKLYRGWNEDGRVESGRGECFIRRWGKIPWVALCRALTLGSQPADSSQNINGSEEYRAGKSQ